MMKRSYGVDILDVVASYLGGSRLETAKVVAAFLSPLATIIGFIFAVRQLRNTAKQVGISADNLGETRKQNEQIQNWKKTEFLASEIKAFSEDKYVRDVLRMMDFSGRTLYYKFHPDSGIVSSMVVYHSGDELEVHEKDGVSVVHLGYALKYHRNRRPISQQETEIRDRFDRYLSYLTDSTRCGRVT